MPRRPSLASAVRNCSHPVNSGRQLLLSPFSLAIYIPLHCRQVSKLAGIYLFRVGL